MEFGPHPVGVLGFRVVKRSDPAARCETDATHALNGIAQHLDGTGVIIDDQYLGFVIHGNDVVCRGVSRRAGGSVQ